MKAAPLRSGDHIGIFSCLLSYICYYPHPV